MLGVAPPSPFGSGVHFGDGADILRATCDSTDSRALALDFVNPDQALGDELARLDPCALEGQWEVDLFPVIMRMEKRGMKERDARSHLQTLCKAGQLARGHACWRGECNRRGAAARPSP